MTRPKPEDRISVPYNVLLTLMEAAEIRRNQWLACADGSIMGENNVIDELYEADADEGAELAEGLRKAIEQAEFCITSQNSHGDTD